MEIPQIPFGYWTSGPSGPHQYWVSVSNLIYLDLASMVAPNADVHGIRFGAEKECNKELLLYKYDWSKADPDSSEAQQKRIEESFSVLESQGIIVEEKIITMKKFFSFQEAYHFYFHSFSKILILRRKRLPSVSNLKKRLVLPSGVRLIPAKMGYQIAFLLSQCMTEKAMQVFDLRRLFLMNEPLEKYDDLFFEITPASRELNRKGEIRLDDGGNLGSTDAVCFLCYY
ncbi:MAG TPA: hypothetical protein VFQ59_01495 [Candidatus Paceibacterota bacterium]|nr:hypothetical protein [Candidatus Paceibacterota bacterium]